MLLLYYSSSLDNEGTPGPSSETVDRRNLRISLNMHEFTSTVPHIKMSFTGKCSRLGLKIMVNNDWMLVNKHTRVIPAGNQ